MSTAQEARPREPDLRGFSRHWFLAVTGGELVGFTIPALVAIASQDARASVQLPALVLAGAAEGTVLGFAQHASLRRLFPTIRRRDWVLATSAAAAVAWFLGLLPSATYGTWSTWPVGVTAIVLGVVGLTLLTSIGAAQALILTGSVPHAARWIAWTAGSWFAGLSAFGAIAPPLWHEGQAPWLTVVIGLAGGAAMAAVMAAVTGLGMTRLVRRG